MTARSQHFHSNFHNFIAFIFMFFKNHGFSFFMVFMFIAFYFSWLFQGFHFLLLFFIAFLFSQLLIFMAFSFSWLLIFTLIDVRKFDGPPSLCDLRQYLLHLYSIFVASFYFHCTAGQKIILLFLSPTPKMDGGHESRAKSVWEIWIIKILDLPPQRDNSLKGVGYSISKVENCSK